MIDKSQYDGSLLDSPYAKGLLFYLLGGPVLTSLYAKTKSNEAQRDFYNYQKSGYERQLEDWHKGFPGREIKYPEFSYEGGIRRMDLGISQSYYNDVVNVTSAQRSIGSGVGGAYRPGRSLYGQSTGRFSRYL